MNEWRMILTGLLILIMPGGVVITGLTLLWRHVRERIRNRS